MGTLIQRLDTARHQLAIEHAGRAAAETALAEASARLGALEAASAETTHRLAETSHRLAEAQAAVAAAELAAAQEAERATLALRQLEQARSAVPQAYEPPPPSVPGLRISRPQALATALDLDRYAQRAPDHASALLDHLDNAGPLATFLRRYLGTETGSRAEVARFALVVELVAQLAGDSWVDLGSFGHDAAYIAMLREDLAMRLFSYQGGRIGIYEDGYRYYDRDLPEPRSSAFIEALDFEAEPLPLEAASQSLVTAFEVLEHFKFGPQQCMTEVNRVLRPGGRLVVTVPNAASAAAFWRLLHGEHPAKCSLYHRDLKLGRIHPSEYTAGQLRALVEAYGFEVDVLTAYSHGDYAPHECRAIGLCHAGNFRGATDGDDDFGESLLLVARKVADVHDLRFPETLFERD